jgi:hypothetical protein
MELRAMKTFYSAREGLVTLEDDVLSIVRQVRQLYGDRIKICLEPTSGKYVFSENCADGTERLIFVADELDPRTLERLLKADSQLRGHEDPYDAAEREQDELMRQKDEQALEGVRDAGERLAWAMEADGKGTHAQILVTKNINAHRQRPTSA